MPIHSTQHKKTEHPRIRICRQCNKKFTRKKALFAHIAAKHPRRCFVCGELLAPWESVRSHRMANHPPQRNNVASTVQLSINAVQNSPHPEYKCDQCNAALRSLERLARHQQEVHIKVKCDHCTRMFKNIAARDAHQAAKHPVRCHYCTCQFPTDALRYQHELTQHPIHIRGLYRQVLNHTASLAMIQHAFPITISPHGSEEYPPSCGSSAAGSSSSTSTPRSSCVSPGSSLSGDYRSESRSLHRMQSLPALTNQVGMWRL